MVSPSGGASGNIMSEDAEKTMDELMAELEGGGDGLDAFDKMLDKAARCSSLSCLPCCIPHKRQTQDTYTHTDRHAQTHTFANQCDRVADALLQVPLPLCNDVSVA